MQTRAAIVLCLAAALPACDLAGGLTVFEAWDRSWAEHDADRRLALLEIATDESVRYISPETREAVGHGALSDVIAGFHFNVPGGTTSGVSGADEHNARARYAWNVRNGALSAALAPDGRIGEAVFFEGPLPPRDD